MPRTAEDFESYLHTLARSFEIEGGTYLVQMPNNGAGTTVAIRISPPIVAFRVLIGAVPEDAQERAELFARVLEYNATDLMHASYGVQRGELVLSGALELPNLDINEVEAMLSDIDLALERHVPLLRRESRKAVSVAPPPASGPPTGGADAKAGAKASTSK